MQDTPDQKSLYERLGGEKVLRELATRFYDNMEQLPEAKIIRDMHPKDMTEAREKFFEFLSGWSGGPQLYQQKYGHPRLRMRHMPFKIDSSASEQWLLCMNKALDSMEISEDLNERLKYNFRHIAEFMINQ